MVFLESAGPKQNIEDRVFDILSHCYSLTKILTESSLAIKSEPKKSLNIKQIEFLVKATGDWDSDTFDIRDAIAKLERDGKVIRDENYNFSCKENES